MFLNFWSIQYDKENLEPLIKWSPTPTRNWKHSTLKMTTSGLLQCPDIQRVVEELMQQSGNLVNNPSHLFSDALLPSNSNWGYNFQEQCQKFKYLTSCLLCYFQIAIFCKSFYAASQLFGIYSNSQCAFCLPSLEDLFSVGMERMYCSRFQMDLIFKLIKRKEVYVTLQSSWPCSGLMQQEEDHSSVSSDQHQTLCDPLQSASTHSYLIPARKAHTPNEDIMKIAQWRLMWSFYSQTIVVDKLPWLSLPQLQSPAHPCWLD